MLQMPYLTILLPHFCLQHTHHGHLQLCHFHFHMLPFICSLDLGPHCLQLVQQLLSRGSLGWGVMQTLAYQLQKRVLFSQLLTEWLNVVPPTLHLSATQDMIWIVRVWVGVGEESTWEYLRGYKGSE